MNERPSEAIDDTYNATIISQLQSELPSLDPDEAKSARRKFQEKAQDVNLTEILDAEEVIVDGLKTAT